MRSFWRQLLRKSLPPDVLGGVRYAVFGLGDSGYVKYNVRSSGWGRHAKAVPLCRQQLSCHAC